MKAKSISGGSAEEIQTVLDQALADGFRPTLAIVFMSIKQDRRKICDMLKVAGADIFGATSCGEFVNGSQTEGSIAILLWDLAKSHYKLLFEEVENRPIEETAKKLAADATATFNNPGMVICSTGINHKGEFFDGPGLVNTLKHALGNDKIFVGGMAGDDLTLSGTYIFNGEKETDTGVAAIVVDADNVSMHGVAITGWKPMGISRTVTKSKGQLVYEIDNKPAIDMYLHYLGVKENNFNAIELRNQVSMHYPFIVERPGGGTFLHTPMSIDHEEHAFQIDVPMPEGTKFWFSVPPDFGIVEEILQEAEKISEGTDADALLVFSCAGRINVLGPLVQSENEGLHEVWKAPMAGFFTYGEFGRDEKGKEEFHSGACSWIALKEK